jgi:hypothetical protein
MGRYPCNHLAGLNRSGHDGTRGHYATIPELRPFENYRSRTDPAPVTNTDAASVHRLFAGGSATIEFVIAVGDIYIRTKHVLSPPTDPHASIITFRLK